MFQHLCGSIYARGIEPTTNISGNVIPGAAPDIEQRQPMPAQRDIAVQQSVEAPSAVLKARAIARGPPVSVGKLVSLACVLIYSQAFLRFDDPARRVGLHLEYS